MIKIVNLNKNFGETTALRNISLQVPPKKITAILGPNGAGKTTLLKIVAGIISQDTGEITITGKSPLERETRRKTAYLPENNPLYLDMETFSFLEWTADLYDTPASYVKEAAKICSLQKAAGKKIDQLSKGYRQRVGIAAALIKKPDLFILDEPTSALDPLQAEEIKNILKEIKKDKTVIVSTHILSEAEDMAERVLVLNKGEIKGDFDIFDLYTKKNEEITLICEKSEKDYGDFFSALSPLSAEKSETSQNTIYKFKFEKDLRKDFFEILKKSQIPVLEVYSSKDDFKSKIKELML